VLPTLDVLVMPLVVYPGLVQDLSVSTIRTFPIFTYLNHQRSIRVFRFENKTQPPAILRASSLVSNFAADLRPRRTSEAISAISKSWNSSPREGSSLYRLVGDFVSEDDLLVSLFKAFDAIAHRFRQPGVGAEASEAPPNAPPMTTVQ
jgi:hypothetical protein